MQRESTRQVKEENKRLQLRLRMLLDAFEVDEQLPEDVFCQPIDPAHDYARLPVVIPVTIADYLLAAVDQSRADTQGLLQTVRRYQRIGHQHGHG